MIVDAAVHPNLLGTDVKRTRGARTQASNGRKNAARMTIALEGSVIPGYSEATETTIDHDQDPDRRLYADVLPGKMTATETERENGTN